MPGYQYLKSDFSGWIWNRARSVGSLGRAYNYPHQVSRRRKMLASLHVLMAQGMVCADHRVLEPVRGSQGAGHRRQQPPSCACSMVSEAGCTDCSGATGSCVTMRPPRQQLNTCAV